MKIATWNVNGIRAREAQLIEWLAGDRPDILCLQEIKASPEQVPDSLRDLQGYWNYWHGQRGYSGVSLHIRRDLLSREPMYAHPGFNHEARIVTTTVGGLVVASVYVPNGGKDFDAKIRFLNSLREFVRDSHAAGLELLLCGDMNVARTDLDVHPKERNPKAIGQLPVERDLFESILSEGLIDVGRTFDPENEALFTWWPPWRQMRQRNIGWRIDYILASRSLSDRLTESKVMAQIGTSDHAPVVAEIQS